VAVAQGRQAERAVFLAILLVSDSNSGLLQQPDDRRQHLLARHARALEISIASLSDLWQDLGEGEHAVVLDRVAHFAPASVVAVLLPAAGVTAGRLQMTAGVGADPDVGPGRRDRQPLDPADDLLVTDQAAVTTEITEGLAGALPADSRAEVGDVAKPGGPRRLHRVSELGRIERARRLPGLRQG